MKIVVMNLILTLLLGIIAIGTAYTIIGINKLKNKVNGEIDKIEDSNTKILLSNALNRIDTLVLEQVDSLSNNIIEELNKLKSENKIPSVEDIQDIVIKIKDKTLKNIDTATIEVLKQETVDIENYVTDLIEEVLEENFINKK